jgi:hypothetical protein
MDTEEELSGALAALQRRSPEELSAFIVSLVCGAPPGVRSYVEAFIAAAEPCKVATIVRREISALRVGEREYDVRHRRSAEIVARAGYTLGISNGSCCRAMERSLESFYASCSTPRGRCAGTQDACNGEALFASCR